MSMTVVDAGLFNAALLTQHDGVLAFDLDPLKVPLLTDYQSLAIKAELECSLSNKNIDSTVARGKAQADKFIDYGVIATSTDHSLGVNDFYSVSVVANLIGTLTHISLVTIATESAAPIGYFQ